MISVIKKVVLRPLSWVYGAGVMLRNKLYDLSVLRSADTAITSIGIGNITVGGTGKTPHTEYLIRLLSGVYETAYLSRGYRRRSKGFVLAQEGCSARDIGDEAYQVYSKFGGVTVAVDGDRRHGVERLRVERPATQLVLLDDCYQHRAIRPDVNILLIDYNRPIYEDSLLPAGGLRESADNTDRADIIIVTKCPADMLPVDMLSARVQISPYPYQNLYFTCVEYREPVSLSGGAAPDLRGYDLLVVTGIAQPQHLHRHLRGYTENIRDMVFDDHHNFTREDFRAMVRVFEGLSDGRRAIIITEKDLARMGREAIPEVLAPYVFVVGIEVRFLFDMGEKFDAEVRRRVRCKI